MPDNNGVQYTNPPQSRNEELLEDIITDQPYTAPPQSEIEEILVSMIDETPYTKPPKSRNADLLLQVKTKYEEGGGGDGSYTFEGIQNINISPVNPADVSDDFKGSSYADTTLADCPSLTDFYSLFYDKYLEENLQEPLEKYTVTKRSLGKDESNTYDIYEYDFCPDGWKRMILLTSGMHAYEVGSIFGMAYFIDNMMDNHDDDSLLDYLYRKVRIKVIPIINPWGYSQSPKVYANARGVNVNRNFDYNGAWAGYPTYSNDPFASNYHFGNYKGKEPFSEAETKILRDWAEYNLGAEFWIDAHTGVGSYKNENIVSISLSASPKHQSILAAHTKLEKWTKDYYHLNTVNTSYTYNSSGSVRSKWYEGTLGRGTISIEQATECASMGMAYNGDRAAIVNYTALLYAYIGEFLVRESQTVNCKKALIQKTQEKLENMRYFANESIAYPTKILISISAVKSVTQYEVGESVGVNDIVVTAHYKDGTESVVTGSSIKKYVNQIDTSQEGIYPLNISYTENDFCRTTSIPITIANSGPVTLNSISAEKTVKRYIVGQQLDLSDITVTAHYSNGTSATVTNSANTIIDASNVDTSIAGTYTIDISYEEDQIVKTTSITIIVSTSINYATVKQGTLRTADGTPNPESLNRVYIETFLPITNNPFHVKHLANSNVIWGGRCYDNSETYIKPIVDAATNTTIGITGGSHDGDLGTGDDVTVTIGSTLVSTVKKVRFLIMRSDKTSNISPADVDGMEVEIDGILYTLQAGV